LTATPTFQLFWTYCATSAKEGSHDPPIVRKCEADEGGPLGAGVQAQASNRLKLLWPKGTRW
jgi:hypothetical protein